MITNTITTIKLEAEEGKIILHKENRLVHGKIIFCPLSDFNQYEELQESEAIELIRLAEEELKKQEEEEKLNQENAEE